MSGETSGATPPSAHPRRARGGYTPSWRAKGTPNPPQQNTLAGGKKSKLDARTHQGESRFRIPGLLFHAAISRANQSIMGLVPALNDLRNVVINFDKGLLGTFAPLARKANGPQAATAFPRPPPVSQPGAKNEEREEEKWPMIRANFPGRTYIGQTLEDPGPRYIAAGGTFYQFFYKRV
ncbi:unnamed protein product, partial [Iphiclides podalirius]